MICLKITYLLTYYLRQLGFLPLSAVRSVTLNLATKFSQCTFSVAEHYELFSGLIN